MNLFKAYIILLFLFIGFSCGVIIQGYPQNYLVSDIGLTWINLNNSVEITSNSSFGFSGQGNSAILKLTNILWNETFPLAVVNGFQIHLRDVNYNTSFPVGDSNMTLIYGGQRRGINFAQYNCSSGASLPQRTIYPSNSSYSMFGYSFTYNETLDPSFGIGMVLQSCSPNTVHIHEVIIFANITGIFSFLFKYFLKMITSCFYNNKSHSLESICYNCTFNNFCFKHSFYKYDHHYCSCRRCWFNLYLYYFHSLDCLLNKKKKIKERRRYVPFQTLSFFLFLI